MRLLARAAAALGLLTAGVVACRVGGALLPGPAAAGIGFALGLGLPGAALLRALGLDARLGALGSLVVLPTAGLVAWVAPLAVALTIGLPLGWVLWPTLAASALVLALAPGIGLHVAVRPAAVAATATLAMAAVASRWQPPYLTGDAFFHAGRVRKLLDLPELSFSGVSAYHHGTVHAGYAFPLLHAVQAVAIRLAGLEPSAAYLDLVAVSAALIPITVFAAGRSVGGQTVGACAAAIAVWDVTGGGGRALVAIEQPGAFVFVLLFPAAVYLIAELHRTPDDRRVAAAICGSVLVVALIHPTYALVLLAVLAAAVVATHRGWRMLAVGVAETAVVFVVIWAAALRGAPRGAGRTEATGDFWTVSGNVLALAGDWIVHNRVPFLAAVLLVVPLLFVRDRRYAFAAALCAGGLALAALPGLTTLLADVIGNGQTRRVWAGTPWVYLPALVIAFAASRERGRRLAALVGAVAVGSVVLTNWHVIWGGWLTIVTSGVAAAATVILLWRLLGPATPQLRPVDAAPMLPAFALVIALLAGGLLHDGRATASALVHGASPPPMRHRLTPGLIAWVRSHDGPPFPVVMAPLRSGPSDRFTGLAFQLIGEADVYAVGLPESRTRAEARTNPVARRRDVVAFFDPASSDRTRQQILDRYDVSYVIVDLHRTPRFARAIAGLPSLTPVYRDRAFRPGFGQYQVWAVSR